MKTGLHVVPAKRCVGLDARRWLVRENGTTIATCRTRGLACRVARALAIQAQCSVRVHRLDGRIASEWSYGNETRRPG